MKFYDVYVLQCSDDFIYIGITNRMNKCLEEGRVELNPVGYTSRERLLKLIFHQEFI